MPTLATNQVALGSNVYFFQSPDPGATDCIIMAHGAMISGNNFRVPANVTVMYEADAGQSVINHHGPIRTRLQLAAAPTIDRRNRYTAGNRCPDQILGKTMGKHWDDPATRDSVQYYTFIEEAMRIGHGLRNWAPHFISIRNRKGPFSKEFVWLSEVVRLVTEYDDSVRQFYSYGCRNYDTSGRLADRAGDRAFAL